MGPCDHGKKPSGYIKGGEFLVSSSMFMFVLPKTKICNNEFVSFLGTHIVSEYFDQREMK